MTSELPKTFDPAEIERRWYAHWEANGLFRPERPDAEPFTIVNPPPNVTGSLHIGHALDNTLQDVVVRYERLRGKDALWVVGTDHAGIATQMVVERNLASQGVKRTDMSREAFVEHVWEWKEQSGGTITRQLRRLGCSMDWSREQFTMDPHFTRAVVKVFVDLYNQGLLYRDKRLVNWDPALKTAISDLEVETREIQGHFWHLKYPLASGSGHISVATTRPETMLADMAVAVHPSDERYAALVASGAKIRLPLTGREVPIVADEHADPELGSGAVKITPGHDFDDFEVGKRAGFKPAEMLNMLDAEARVIQTADGLIPEELVGLDRFEARRRVVELLEEQGLLEKVEDRVIATPFGDRGGVVIEPWLTDQWYVDAAKLAIAPMQAVRDGRIKIVPKALEKTFFNWMENIQPWCVSRQLWWGHRIPAWYALDGNVFVAETEGEVLGKAREFYGADAGIEFGEMLEGFNAPFPSSDSIALYRDPDVLDTWFSSALWPFATLGWPCDPPPPGEGDHARHGGGAPEAGRDGGGSDMADVPLHQPSAGPPPRSGEDCALLAKHYPNDLLISGFDILFFWDARMMMQGLHFMGDVPWKRLYLHGLVRAADGQKMSKSKGNVVDPLLLIDKYGADALRFFMAAMESQGRDVKMDESRVEGYRNFATKLWNAARFCQANGIGASQSIAAPPATSAVNKWIVGEVVETLRALDKAMAELRFDVAAGAIYRFVWDTFCDWYLELIKPVLSPLPLAGGAGGEPVAEPSDTPSPSPSRKREGDDVEETRAVAGWALDQILVMLHPFMPFITEELWHAQGARPYELIVAKWPEPKASVDKAAKTEVETVIEIVSGIRAQRTEVGIPPSAILGTAVLIDEKNRLPVINRWRNVLTRMARIRPAEVERVRHDRFVLRSDSLTDEFVLQTKFDTTSFTALQFPVGANTFISAVDGIVDLDAEKARLAKAREAAITERDSLAARLANPAFVERAKPEAVAKARADHAHHAAEAERLRAALARLG